MSRDASRFLRDLVADSELRPLIDRDLPDIDFSLLHTLASQRGYRIDLPELRSALRVFKRVTANPSNTMPDNGLLG